MKKYMLLIGKIVLCVYIGVCVLLYFIQEKLIFFPDKLSAQYRFSFAQPFEELTIACEDGTRLNGVLFKTPSPRGLIFYLHGNGGALDSWGDVAATYERLGYDVFILDYRGYGKSEGHITGQNQFFSDNQAAYNVLKQLYTEDKIVVLGYSIGTGPATKLAADNHPRMLILQAPYYSLTDMMRHNYPGVPAFLLKYKFATHEYIKRCKMPVVIFHGNADEVIYYGSSLKLKALLKPGDQLITLNGQEHNGITENEDYQQAIEKILNGSLQR